MTKSNVLYSMNSRTTKITTAPGSGFVMFALEGALLFVEFRA